MSDMKSLTGNFKTQIAQITYHTFTEKDVYDKVLK